MSKGIDIVQESFVPLDYQRKQRRKRSKGMKILVCKYMLLHRAIAFEVPRKDGKGFIKNYDAFRGELLDDLKFIDNTVGDYCTLDAYLSISIKSEITAYHEKRIEALEALKPIIKEVWPYITHFEEA